VMKDGRIEQEGAPDILYENPANRFVAGFLGAINLFEGRVAGVEQGVLLIESEVGPLAVEHAALAPGTAITLAVRPEKIRIVSEGGAGERNVLAGIIRAFAYRGEASTYEVELPGGQVVRATLANNGSPGTGFGQGQPVRLSFDPAAARVLEG
jgi:putrescine transport system ATP-binding protein